MELCDVNAAEPSRRIGMKQFSVVELPESRFCRIDKPGGQRIVAQDRDRAMLEARSRRRDPCEPVGPPHGLPVGIEDMVETGPAHDLPLAGIPRLRPKAGRPPREAFAHGFKTNSPEWAASGNFPRPRT